VSTRALIKEDDVPDLADSDGEGEDSDDDSSSSTDSSNSSNSDSDFGFNKEAAAKKKQKKKGKAATKASKKVSASKSSGKKSTEDQAAPSWKKESTALKTKSQGIFEELKGVTAARIWGKEVSHKDFEALSKKSSAVQVEIEDFKSQLPATDADASSMRVWMDGMVSALSELLENVSMFKRFFDKIRKQSMVPQILAGNMTDDFLSAVRQLDLSMCEELAKYCGFKFADHSVKDCFGFITLKPDAPGLNFGTLVQASQNPDQLTSVLLSVQRDIIHKWFDSMRSVRTLQDVTVHLPSYLEAPTIFRTTPCHEQV
jgi:hypothetical protein